MVEPILQTAGLSRRFGGLTAVSEVSLAARMGEVHAVIGPNGAGKTTLINMLSGDLRPSAGSIRLDGAEVAGLPADRIARLGVARSYQRTNIFAGFTALENCRLAAQARLASSMRLLRPARSHRALIDAAGAALARVGLGPRAGVRAAALSHGEQRQLEIAMALAIAPRLLLLDEPLAGMGPEESARMVELIGSLGQSHAVVLVEHDMDAVFAVAGTLTVMVDGRVLESGPPERVRASPAVQEAYLGAGDA